MPLIYTYPDAYLGPLITEAREAQALEDIAILGDFPASHKKRLVVLRAYIITAMESKRTPDDLFTEKLKDYRKEFADFLPVARAAQAAALGAANQGMSPFTIDLERA